MLALDLSGLMAGERRGAKMHLQACSGTKEMDDRMRLRRERKGDEEKQK